MIRRALPLLVATWIFAATGYLVQVLLARELGPADFGSVGLALSIVSLANVVQASGTPQAVSLAVARELDQPRDVLSQGLRRQSRISIGLIALLALASPALAAAFDESNLRSGLWILAAMVPGFGVMVTLNGYWNGLQRFGKQAGVTISYAVGKLALVAVLTWCFGLVGALAGYAVAPAVGVLVGVVGVGPRCASTRVPQLGGSGPFVLVALLTLALYSADLYIVRLLVADPGSVGHYVAAQGIALVPIMCSTPFAQVVMPRVAKALAAGAQVSAGLAMTQALRQAALIIVPAAAALSVASPLLAGFLYGHEFADAGSIARVLVASTAIVGLLAVAVGALCGTGRVHAAVGCLLVAVSVSVCSGALLAQRWEAVGASVGVGAGALAGLAAVLSVLRRTSGIAGLGWPTIIRTAAAAALAALVSVMPDTGLGALIGLVLAALVVGAFYWVSGEFSAEEKRRAVAAMSLGPGDNPV